MKIYRKFSKNAKALSPVVASIILIAVTVAVSVVVAAWMGGMTIGLMGNAEQVSVSNPYFTSETEVQLTLRNTGAASVTIASATVDGKTVDFAGPGVTPVNDIAKGDSALFTITLTGDDEFAPGAQYQIGMVTAKGTSIVYTATYNP